MSNPSHATAGHPQPTTAPQPPKEGKPEEGKPEEDKPEQGAGSMSAILKGLKDKPEVDEGSREALKQLHAAGLVQFTSYDDKGEPKTAELSTIGYQRLAEFEAGEKKEGDETEKKESEKEGEKAGDVKKPEAPK